MQRSSSTLLPAGTRRAYVRTELCGGLELLSAHYRQHAFARHAQQRAIIGVLEEGSVTMSCGGASHVATVGDVLFVAPGTPHEARGVGDGRWTYKALYPSVDHWVSLKRSLGSDGLTGGCVVRDWGLATHISTLHHRVTEGTASEEDVTNVLLCVARQVGERLGPTSYEIERECKVAEQVKALLDATATHRVALDDVASATRMSKFHLARAFQRVYGMPPYAYSLGIRVGEAQRLLQEGVPISSTALAVGFADQAHLTRHFLRTVGVTPGEYQRAFA